MNALKMYTIMTNLINEKTNNTFLIFKMNFLNKWEKVTIYFVMFFIVIYWLFLTYLLCYSLNKNKQT